MILHLCAGASIGHQQNYHSKTLWRHQSSLLWKRSIMKDTKFAAQDMECQLVAHIGATVWDCEIQHDGVCQSYMESQTSDQP